MSEIKGDFHNFNRFVDFKRIGNMRFYHKPRPVFWELFFFGDKSPLKHIFSTTSICMDLKLKESKSMFDNDVFEIASSVREVNVQDFYSFGQLLAYCFYFGLQDIHKHNILITPYGLQVVDIEQAFSELLLPNQTLLLPVNSEIVDSAGINVLTKTTLGNLPNSEAKALLDGFLDLTTIFLDKIGDIRNILLGSMDDFRTHPIRIFFRGTKDYVEKINGRSLVSNFFEEEMIQIQRDDVPYFFMTLEKEEVFFYVDPYWNHQNVQVPEGFKKYTTFCAKDPLSLITREKIEHQWAKGMLFLTKKMSSLRDEDLVWPICSVIRRQGSIQFNSTKLKMSTH